MGVIKSGFLFLLFTVSLYPVVILLLTNPWLQRHALYAHKLHSGFWHDVNNPESFGFAQKQVTPFNISTPDKEILYAWHILPLSEVYTHQDALAAADPLDQTLPLQLLKSDPEARVVINFHGNAGHVAQGWRTDTYRALSLQPHTHTFTLDYRGFGLSTGSPTEQGLITDGISLVNYILFLGIPPSQITILGQSLGTAVATAVGLHFADPDTELLPLIPGEKTGELVTFAGIVLVAPFTSLPDLLLHYHIGGLIPILSPIRNVPFLLNIITSHIQDRWPTSLRLAAYTSSAAKTSLAKSNGKGNVHILHARDDQDISFVQGEKLFAMAVGREWKELPLGVTESEGKARGGVDVRIEVLEHGGHNRVVTYANVGMAVMRAFDRGVKS